jgi:hypothetical protein
VKAALLLLALAAASRPETPRTLTILYLADLGGQLEPCGCSLDQRGGLPRLAALVARLRRESPGALLVAGGDLLFEGPLDPGRREVALIRARAAAAVLRRMGLAATVAGERDLAAGEAFVRETRLPFGEARRAGAVGLGAPGKVPAAPLRVALLHRGGTREAAPLAAALRAEGVDLVLTSHRETLTDDDVNRALLGGPVPVVQVQSRGQSLARIDVRLTGDRSRGFAVLEGPAQREEEIDLAELRAAEYRRRAEAARADGSEELARALAAKVDELLGQARALRQAPLPEPPPDRPSLTVSFLPVTLDLPEDPVVRRIVDRAHAAAARADLAAARAHPGPARRRLPERPSMRAWPPRRPERPAPAGSATRRPSPSGGRRPTPAPTPRCRSAAGSSTSTASAATSPGGASREAPAASTGSPGARGCSARPVTAPPASTPPTRPATCSASPRRTAAAPATRPSTRPASSPGATGSGCWGPGTGVRDAAATSTGGGRGGSTDPDVERKPTATRGLPP